jgi:VWFA-related protein
LVDGSDGAVEYAREGIAPDGSFAQREHMAKKRLAHSIVICVLLASTLPAVPQETAEEPRDLNLIEQTGRRLAQLDVSVSGPDHAIGDLTAADFELIVGGKFIESFIVDRACSIEERIVRTTTEEPGKTTTTGTPPAPLPLGPKPTYLFYFDQHHLTPAGRQNSLDTARTIVDQLITEGARGMIVSAGKYIATIEPMTDDRNLLQDALDRLERDNDQWDVFAYQEDSRIEHVMRELQQDADTTKALNTARQYQREERFRTDKALRLFEITIGTLTDLDPPKAVLYFADSMRKNAGEHYTSYFGRQAGDRDPTLSKMETDGFMANNAFDRVVEAAAANEVRLYTVQGEGMLAPSMTTSRGNSGNQGQPNANNRRRFDAQNSLVGMARETGGQAFLHGAPGKKIATQIEKDLACLYLISFDVAGMPEDRPLSVTVRSLRDKVKASTRGQIVLASAEKKKTTRLLAAFTGIVPDSDNIKLEAVIIPTGYDKGMYTALVQIRAPSSPLPKTSWEIGASLVSRGRVAQDVSGRIEVDRPSVPVIFEAEMTFGPGPYQLVMVAHEQTTDMIARAEIEADWPDPDAEEVTLSPLALLQPSEGAFLRDGKLRRSGSLGRTSTEHIEPGLPAAVIGLVCRDKSRKSKKAGIVIERRLVGETEAPFTNLELSDSGIRCIQLRDIIKAGTLTEGRFTYELKVTDKTDRELTTATLEFAAIDATLPADGL